MSTKHPIIAITGSSGAGTTTVMQSFVNIFRREDIKAQVVEGDTFHRYNRARDARAHAAPPTAATSEPISHFGPEANLFGELEETVREYGETGAAGCATTCTTPRRPRRYKQEPGTFTAWEADAAATPTCCSTKDCTARSSTASVDVARHVDLLVGVVPIINLEWIQKLHRDQHHARLQPGGGDRHDPAPHAGLREPHLPAVLPHARQLPARADGGHANPFIARDIPSAGRVDARDPLRQPEGHRLSRTCSPCCTTRS